MNQTEKLKNLVLAPYIIKATALIGKKRGVGGNQFRHAIATMGILIDYKYMDNYVLLKASVIHDLLEDVPETNEDELRCIDDQANQVVDLVLEVTRSKSIAKTNYLKGILEKGSQNAKILKVADRISNLTDLHRDQYSKKKMSDYLNQTEKYVLPMAIEVDERMAIELRDLITKRRTQLNFFKYPDILWF
jgi:(p)ppGpp synthase/HD superfamily hydrolase